MILRTGQSGLLTRTAATGVSFARAEEKLTAFVELEAAIRAAASCLMASREAALKAADEQPPTVEVKDAASLKVAYDAIEEKCNGCHETYRVKLK